MPKSVRLKSFELVARDINEIDVGSLHALTVASLATPSQRLGLASPVRPGASR